MADIPLADAIVLFGGTGDLSQRMLLPSLYNLDADGFLPQGLRVIATARAEMAHEDFVELVRNSVETRSGKPDEAVWARFAKRLGYVGADATQPEGAAKLKAALGEAKTPMYFLALSPSLYGRVCAALAAAGLAGPTTRIVLEKPIGRDLESSKVINAAVAEVFSEDRVFRIDHYLGKETVQNLLTLRFANVLFEPLWNANAIDHVQITVAETIGVGERVGYYDRSGALRDMVQNHILQLLCLVAMEPPATFNADAVRNEKLKVLQALRPIGPREVAAMTVRGQYRAGAVDGQPVPGYLDELGHRSDTETFVALKAEVLSWRWSGVPFYLRTGKRLAARASEIIVQYRSVPHSIFSEASRHLVPNRLVLRLQPDEGMKLYLMSKDPGPGGLRFKNEPLNLSYAESLTVGYRDAYERLLMDVVRGNPTLFMRKDEVAAAWRWVDPILDGWASEGVVPRGYTAGSWGPSDATALLARDGRTWHEDLG